MSEIASRILAQRVDQLRSQIADSMHHATEAMEKCDHIGAMIHFRECTECAHRLMELAICQVIVNPNQTQTEKE